MITFLHGKLVEMLPTQVTVDVHGIGYEVLIPLRMFNAILGPMPLTVLINNRNSSRSAALANP